MSQVSLGKAVAIITMTMFKASNARRSDNVTLLSQSECPNVEVKRRDSIAVFSAWEWICSIQEAHFHTGDYDVILQKKFDLFSVYYDGCSCGWGVILAGKPFLVDISLKYQIFHFIGNYAPNDPREQAAFLRPIDAFMMTSRLVILASDWHAVVGTDTDRRI